MQTAIQILRVTCTAIMEIHCGKFEIDPIPVETVRGVAHTNNC